MSTLTYDQKSEIRLAFDEAFVAPERRRSFRVKHQVEAQICQWQNSQQGAPFTVTVEDFSPTGVGMMHKAELPIGSQYLIKVPREQWGDLMVVMTVVRCEPHPQGDGYQVGLELSNVMDSRELEKYCTDINAGRRTSKRTRNLLIMLGIFGLGMAVVLG